MQALPTITLAENQTQNVSLPIGVSAVQLHNASTGFLMVDISGSSTYVGPQSWVTIPLGGQTTSMRLTLLDASVGTVYATVFMATDGNLPNTLVSGSLNQQQVTIESGTVDISTGSVDITGNVSTMSTDQVIINETISANISGPGFTYTNLFIDISAPSPPSHAYLVELYSPGVNPLISPNGFIQAQVLWWKNSYVSPGNYFFTNPLVTSPKLNLNTSNYLLSTVIPASLISNTLLLQILVYIPTTEDEIPSNISLRLGITGYTAAIPFTNNDIDYNGLTVAQNNSLATNTQVVYLENASTQYTIISNPSTSSNNIKLCSIWGYELVDFMLYTPFVNGVQIALLNSTTMTLSYLIPPGSYLAASSSSSGVYAGANYTYI